MISKAEAIALAKKCLAQEPARFRHSLAVAKRMKALAAQFALDEDKWYVTGVLHDIDLPLTIDNMSQHGLLAAAWLEGLLPPDAILAIQAHDACSGIECGTWLAHALRFADAVDNSLKEIPIRELRSIVASGDWEAAERRHPTKRSHLATMRDFVKRWPTVRI